MTGEEPIDAAAAELEATVHELRHRLRNAFAVCGAIILASGREDAEHREFAGDLARRLSALSLVQARLLDEPGNQTPLPDLAGEVIAAMIVSSDAIRLEPLPRCMLDENRARLVALALSELCAESLRHGALGQVGGSVDLAGSVAGQRLSLDWREGPFGPATAAGDESGLRLIARMAQMQGGTFSRERHGAGRTARLELPLAG